VGILASSALAPAVVAYEPFTFAFQPIIDAVDRQVYSYEELVRGTGGESAAAVLRRTLPADLHDFDLRARVVAIEQAARLGVNCRLNLNFLSQSPKISPHAISSIFEAAATHRFPIERIVLEVTEGEVIDDAVKLGNVLNTFRAQGLAVAIDDFGAGKLIRFDPRACPSKFPSMVVRRTR
jgi:EAL domain-containing protein (putative c-di-GMP-specific phosphodiesterase class I)